MAVKSLVVLSSFCHTAAVKNEVSHSFVKVFVLPWSLFIFSGNWSFNIKRLLRKTVNLDPDKCCVPLEVRYGVENLEVFFHIINVRLVCRNQVSSQRTAIGIQRETACVYQDGVVNFGGTEPNVLHNFSQKLIPQLPRLKNFV